MTRKPKQKEQKVRSLLFMIAVGMIHLAIIFAVAMFAAVRLCRWLSEIAFDILFNCLRSKAGLRNGSAFFMHISIRNR